MNIGVVFEGNLQGGGGYQQQISTILELQIINRYYIIAFVFSEENKNILELYGLKAIHIKSKLIDKVIKFINRLEIYHPFARKVQIKSLFEKALDANNIDLVYFLTPSFLSLELQTHNYIITLWDLCHRDTPEFPEVNYFREFENRELLYTKSLKKAVAILVDSSLGKDNVVQRYCVNENRVFIAPFAPSVNAFVDSNINVKTKYKIQSDYIYYPAQFWSHKNHVYIIDAIAILKSKGIILTAIFSGSNKGNLNYVLEYAHNCGVNELIKYIGFAPNEEIYSLYKNALAMVMPSYFGPTNIPPLEAFAIGTPVVYSDLDGLREQVGNGALLCNLKNSESLANHLMALRNSEELRNEMIQKGSKRLSELQKSSILDVLGEIFDDYAIKLKCWKHQCKVM
ncbi:MAG: glycosyltransferase family 4 protein [Sulfuricurvum sp.]|uniref:glycosyltransferase family 4 protein n=1 Tax=Sulfuricurvum sp. TaxID=2025608 RepID=UPI0025D4E9C5|nr:glycosyltransferase family 1 protein [Sulfuricurvum sp.]MBV5320177.1 glycosyltransferase family 4 protein [Sulfuricurvum sp.]